MIPNQKFGIAYPKNAKRVARWSLVVYWLAAEYNPIAGPRIKVMIVHGTEY
jgi:hypothetical protein